MKNYIPFTFLIFLSCGFLQAQTKADTLFAKALYAKADSLTTIDPDQTILYLDSLDQFLSNTKIDKYQWRSYLLRANATKDLNKYKESLIPYSQTINLLEEMGDKKNLSIVYVNLANTYRNLGQDSLALSSLTNVLNVCNDTTQYDRKLSAFAYFSIGQLYDNVNDSMAIVNYLKSNDIAKLIDYKELLGGVNHNLAIILKRQGKCKKAIEYIKKAETFYGPNHRSLVLIYNAWAQCLHKLGDSKESIKKFLSIINKPKANLENRVHAMNSLSIVYKETGQFKKAEAILIEAASLAKGVDYLDVKYGEIQANIGTIYMDTERYAESLKHFLLAKPYILGSRKPELSNKAFLMENILNVKLRIKNNGEKDKDLEQFILYNDSLFQQTEKSIDNELLEKYSSEIKQLENDQLKSAQFHKELTIQRQRNYLIIGGLILGLICMLSFLLWRQKNNQKTLSRNLKSQRDQIKILNRELNHRVKNNLAFMSSLLEMQGRRTNFDETRQALKESESRINALSLVHMNLFKDDNDTEVNLESYLEEIVLHLKEIYDTPEKEILISYNFTDYTIDAEHAMRVGLILNELITNSIKHAFNSIENPLINIETQKIDGKLLLLYKDNGPGIQEQVLVNNEAAESMGVKLISLLTQQLEKDVVLQIG